LFVLVPTASCTQTAAYLRIDGVTIDPIQNVGEGASAYSGTKLGPNATPTDMDLAGANLIGADLGGTKRHPRNI